MKLWPVVMCLCLGVVSGTFDHVYEEQGIMGKFSGLLLSRLVS